MVDQLTCITQSKLVFGKLKSVAYTSIGCIYFLYRIINFLLRIVRIGWIWRFYPIEYFFNVVFLIHNLNKTRLIWVFEITYRNAWVQYLINFVTLKFVTCAIAWYRIGRKEVFLDITFVFVVTYTWIGQYSNQFAIQFDPIYSWCIRAFQTLKAVVEQALCQFIGAEQQLYIGAWVSDIGYPWHTNNQLILRTWLEQERTRCLKRTTVTEWQICGTHRPTSWVLWVRWQSVFGKICAANIVTTFVFGQGCTIAPTACQVVIKLRR